MVNLLTATPDLAVKRIPLTQGQFALVDAVDYTWLMQWKWCAVWKKNTFYAVRSVFGETATIYMHREIIGCTPGDGVTVDHKKHDTLDNRRSELLITNVRGNGENRNDQSSYGIGVIKSRCGRYESRLVVNGKSTHIGTFDTPTEAAQARIDYLETLPT